MSVIYKDYSDSYTIQSASQSINVSVTIGDGQTGSYSIFLGKALMGTNDTANIGTKATVAGQKATIVTTVMDTLEETNWTSATITVTEGNTGVSKTFGPLSEQVPQNQDTCIYTLQISFS